jgi:hypothetical protein
MAGTGGARPGAGRKQGAVQIRTREAAERILSKAGSTPLDVMVLDMQAKLDAGDLSGAADRARDCAPYVHAKLSSSNVTVRRIQSLAEISDAELAALAGEPGTADAAGGQGLLN